MTNSLVTNTLAVLAFMVAFYALLARERKTPYILNFLFPPAALLFLSIILESISQIIQAWFTTRNANPATHSSSFNQSLQSASIDTHILGVLLFYGGVVWIATNIWRLHNRQVNFRDDHAFKNLKFYRWIRAAIRSLQTAPSYEHDPKEFDPSVLRDVLSPHGFDRPSDANVKTIASCGESLYTTDKITVLIAAALLRQGWLVQYTTCDRHPVEWIEKLQCSLSNDWKNYTHHVAVVDGYTPHFGFTDSIHTRQSRKLVEQGISYTETTASYAGVHSATAKAFNKFKSKAKSQAENEFRPPTLLIYEGCRALVDLESVEQYRIFLRHVITSERMWGSMVTFFVEPEADESTLKLIGAYADCLRSTGDKEVSDGK